MKRVRSCWKCATDTPHPFGHWHAWCSWCRRPKIFRGSSCKACDRRLRILAREILDQV